MLWRDYVFEMALGDRRREYCVVRVACGDGRRRSWGVRGRHGEECVYVSWVRLVLLLLLLWSCCCDDCCRHSYCERGCLNSQDGVYVSRLHLSWNYKIGKLKANYMLSGKRAHGGDIYCSP